MGVTHEAIPAGAKVSSESIPHTWTVPKKLHRTDILAVGAMGEREDRCDAAGLPSWETCGSEAFHADGLSSLVARLTGLLEWVDCQQVKS